MLICITFTACLNQLCYRIYLKLHYYILPYPTIIVMRVNCRGLSPAANDTIMGVIGMDVTVKYLCDILVDTIDQCSQNGQESVYAADTSL